MGPELIVLSLGALHWLISLRMFAALRACGRDRESGAALLEKLSIIIPARNEAHHLPRLLDSLRSQTAAPLEVLVVDDDSTDGTAEVAAAHGATVIQSSPLPAGWRGKSWACEQGAARARGELLMFLDADCWFESGGLEAVLARYPGGAFSVAPYHRVEKPYEELSAFFNLIMIAATVPVNLLGQCLLIRREDYQLGGGHASVKDKILENVCLANKLREAGVRTSSTTGKGTLAFRMYPDGLPSLIAGWTKGFAAGAAATPRSTLILISTWISGLILGLFGCLITPWALLIYLAFAVQLAAMLRRIGNFSSLTALFYPLPLFFYIAVFVRSLGGAGKTVKWKGREVNAG
ncbi:glycosyltransferase [Luteolibacter arcticus]|uniref:Glycosyltransferase n=1 Tax=Luteolibacter arcticus TaxID=1581411 RepID=A0ABT3GIS8_9BACT|nr:glycosyltransferase [Luteolibacter arcticus]MCW1923396.1 glycosyltransferase [Luteolibacter arcticus]